MMSGCMWSGGRVLRDQYTTPMDEAVEPSLVGSSEQKAPPTSPGVLVQPARRSGWPGVLGVSAIAVGIVGAGVYALGLVAGLFMSPSSVAGSGLTDESRAALERLEGWVRLGNATHVLAGLALLAGGILLVLRRRGAGAVCFVYAGLKAAAIALATLPALEQMNLIMGSTAVPGSPAIINSIAKWSTIAGVLWGLLLPAFVVVWFLRPSIRREMSGWSAKGKGV
jgi:hypothetical protein